MPQRPDDGRPFKPSALAAASNTPVVGRTTAIAGLQKQALIQHAAEGGPLSNFPKLKVFLSSYVIPWVWNYLKNVFRRKHPYPSYARLADTGVYPLRPAVEGSPIRLALAGDWATGTEESWEVGTAMSDWKPDYTVHLGDVYYVGDLPEVTENFLGGPGGHYTPVKWPTGAVGEFALIGNHEMYVGGGPYFTAMLPTLRTGMGGFQQASFFALETEHWRIIALDTGYNSVGLPLLGSIPWIKKLSFVGANCRLHDELIAWLRTTVKPRENPKPTLLLSHHQYYTSFQEEISGVPADQLSEFFSGQEVVWIWGHEHRLAVYGSYAPNGKVQAYGRCLGHGGMPVETGLPVDPKPPLLYRDCRTDYYLDQTTQAGWNGYLQLTLDGPAMNLEYLDIKKKLLYAESFVGSPGGGLTCIPRTKLDLCQSYQPS